MGLHTATRVEEAPLFQPQRFVLDRDMPGRYQFSGTYFISGDTPYNEARRWAVNAMTGTILNSNLEPIEGSDNVEITDLDGQDRRITIVMQGYGPTR